MNENETSVVSIVAWILGFIFLIVFGFTCYSRIESIRASVRSMSETLDEVILSMKETGEIALSGTREAHERIDRMDKRLSTENENIQKILKRVNRIEENIEALKTAKEYKVDIRTETDNPTDARESAPPPDFVPPIEH